MLPLNRFISIALFGLVVVQAIFALNFILSLRSEKVGPNPWKANSLEWASPSPPPHGNFQHMPVVYRGPYEYSLPGAEEDYILQTEPDKMAGGAERPLEPATH
jgi:cytochrome c oxidase subunit 1